MNEFRSDRLKEARRDKEWTQAELAERVGCSKRRIMLYETGEVVPGLEIIHELACILGVNVYWLIGLSDDRYDFAYVRPYVPPSRPKIRIDDSFVRRRR